jgi:hypothetical protein
MIGGDPRARKINPRPSRSLGGQVKLSREPEIVEVKAMTENSGGGR